MTIPILYYMVVVFGAINLIRMAFFLVASDIYNLKNAMLKKKRAIGVLPSFSVVIPTHNEEGNIGKAIASILANDYPKDRLQIVIVNDGSTDNTVKIVKQYIAKYPKYDIKLVNQKGGGKANALNKGIEKYSKGELVMCLDADSSLASDALKNVTFYFENKKVVGLAANVKITKRPGLLNLIQQYEYLVCYQMKRAESLFNIEYIVGGIGSTFRKSVLHQVGHYDTNTVTEDIDLTMKILKLGNKENKIVYGADVIAYTEAVLSIDGLLKQRHRWKWGRCQTFLKNLELFFATDKKYTRGLTHFYLPFAIYGDIAYFFEPILLAYILVNSIKYSDPFAILSAWIVITAYITFNILGETTTSFKDKVFYVIFAPTMYFLFYILSFVEYIALIKAVINLPKLKQSIGGENVRWIHVKRPEIDLIDLG